MNALDAHRKFLWDLCYRMTGDAAEADDLVQETFARALAKGAAAPRAWLTRVAANLALDHLRRRKRRGYVGQWLPAPVDTDDLASPQSGAAARYDRLESATLAFLLALEALTPLQRAVLLLRDVFDEPARDAAQALRIGEANLRQTLLRARARMAAYDRSRVVPTEKLQERTRQVLAGFMGAIASGDLAAARSMLAEEVRAQADGAGRYKAGLVSIVSPEKVLRLYRHLFTSYAPAVLDVRLVSGLPSLVVEIDDRPPGVPPRALLQAQLDEHGRIGVLRAVLVPEKLTHVRSARSL